MYINKNQYCRYTKESYLEELHLINLLNIYAELYARSTVASVCDRSLLLYKTRAKLHFVFHRNFARIAAGNTITIFETGLKETLHLQGNSGSCWR